MFVFLLLGMFGLLIGTRPAEYFTLEYQPTAMQKSVREKFDAVDFIVYTNMASDNMTHPYTSLTNGSDPPDWEAGLPQDNYLEIWWSYEGVPFYADYLEARHTTKNWWGGWDYHYLIWSYLNGTKIYQSGLSPGQVISAVDKDNLVAAWDSAYNVSKFFIRCYAGHISTSILVYPTNQSQTVSQAWDAGKLSYMLSYDVNMTQSAYSAWTLIGELLTFQAPDLGIPGVGGLILGQTISFVMWAMICYLLYKLFTGIVPFLSGGSGD